MPIPTFNNGDPNLSIRISSLNPTITEVNRLTTLVDTLLTQSGTYYPKTGGIVNGNVWAVQPNGTEVDVGVAVDSITTGDRMYMYISGGNFGLYTRSATVGNHALISASRTTSQFYTFGEKFVINGAFDQIYHTGDNVAKLGTATHRWSEIFCGNGVINTSDARLKTGVYTLTDDEVKASVDIGKAIGTYKWLDMIRKKGDANARKHVGLTVQNVMSIMRSYSLDPFDYGFICYDKWDEEFDEEGNMVRGAGDLYAFRMNELLAFIAAGFNQRLIKLEETLSDLGG